MRFIAKRKNTHNLYQEPNTNVCTSLRAKNKLNYWSTSGHIMVGSVLGSSFKRFCMLSICVSLVFGNSSEDPLWSRLNSHFGTRPSFSAAVSEMFAGSSRSNTKFPWLYTFHSYWLSNRVSQLLGECYKIRRRHHSRTTKTGTKHPTSKLWKLFVHKNRINPT